MLPGLDGFLGVGVPTFNPADLSSAALSNANATATITNTGGARSLDKYATGSWFVEIKLNTFVSELDVGICNASATLNAYPSNGGNGIIYTNIGTVTYNGSNVTQAGTASFTGGDVIGVHLLFGSGVRFYKNGVAQGTGFYTNLSTAQTLYFVLFANAAGTNVATVNASPQYTLPAGASYWGS